MDKNRLEEIGKELQKIEIELSDQLSDIKEEEKELSLETDKEKHKEERNFEKVVKLIDAESEAGHAIRRLRGMRERSEKIRGHLREIIEAEEVME